MTDKTLGNPAAVGLAGFGGTTLLLQFANLELCGTGVVIWAGLFFGGLMQLCAGLQEFKTGNNFGFAAFSSYGAFWMALGGIHFCVQTNIFPISTADIGWFLVMWTIFTFVLLLGAVRQNWMLAFLFLTLLLGFIFLDISHLGGPAWFTKVAAVDLIVCALTAWYIMAHVILGQFNVSLSVGKAWVREQ